MTRQTPRRRIVVATVVSGALLLVGPAAYGVATAADAVDDPAAASSQNLDDGEQQGQNADGRNADEQDQGDQDQDGRNQDGGDGANAGGEQGSGGDGDAAGGQAQNDQGGQDDNGLGVLATDCSASRLEPHDGFQKGNRCVSTAFGEVGGQDRNPSLLITDAPEQVSPDQPFQLTVSTRNLVRDRFLAAGEGGYYKESSVLNGEGLQRGHFHTACRILPNADEAPDAAPEPAFFLATEDGAGGSSPDDVRIDVPPVGQGGELQCSSWAGDGSHRVPMMQRADQTPAFDSVRITVG